MEKIDWRMFKRINLEVPINIYIRLENGKTRQASGLTSNISYSGVYFRSSELKDATEEVLLNVSISIPRDYNRDLFYSRFIGKGRIVRIDERPTPTSGTSGERGVALEFSPDLTRLHAA